MYEKTTLPNGLRILTHRMPTAYSVSAAIMVGAGSRHELAECAGISHFVEHMLFKGTERRPTPREISETIEGVGGGLNAGTEKELTTVWSKAPYQHRALVVDLLADMLLHSRFDAAEVEKERHVITEELHMSEDVPQDVVNSMIDELIWPGHPLGREIAGSEATVAQLPQSALLDYVAARYVPNNAVLAVAGNISHAQVVDQAADVLGGWQPRPVAGYTAAPPSPGPVRQAMRIKDIEQGHLCLSAGGLPREHPDRRALDLLNLILGGGMSSRLFQEIRERRALAYDVAAYLDYYADTGASIVYAGTDPEQIPDCVVAILDELRRMRREPVAAEELARAKEYFKGRMVLGLEDSYGLAHWLAGQELLTGRIRTVDDIVAQIDAVTADDLLRLAEATLSPDQLRLALVGPFEADDAYGTLLDAA